MFTCEYNIIVEVVICSSTIDDDMEHAFHVSVKPLKLFHGSAIL